MSVKWEATGSNSYQATDRQSGEKSKKSIEKLILFLDQTLN